jgi:hypothetical protein
MCEAIAGILTKEFLTRAEASQFLTFSKGLVVSVKSLAKYVTIGGGPKYHKWGGRVVYNRTELINWSMAKLSRAYENSSQELMR